MKHIIPALLLAASVPAFAADSAVSTTDTAPVATYTVPTPAGFPFAVETQILPPDDTYQVKITDQKTGKVQIIDLGPRKEKISSLVYIQEDFNGDGHLDIAVPIDGAYNQVADELYLFNPATRQFQTPPPLQGIAIVGNVEVIRKGCIRVEYKSSIMDYDEEDYCWKNGGWEMLRLKNTNAHKKPKGK
ncbi:FG-GAP repeat protein [Kingella denitrificans]|uniref:FG-GAP repeat protein n=1 Tax=Kingella denitrificans TaxID=502 RepID=UPI0028D1249A|nr:hypothetical protein [Kingella denitrificans]